MSKQKENIDPEKINQTNDNFPIINVHTHIFTKDHVPEYLAKKIFPWPFYKWLATGTMLGLIKSYLERNQYEYTYLNRNKKWRNYNRKKFWTQTPVLSAFYNIFLALVWIIFAYYLLDLIKPLLNDTLLFGWYYKFIQPLFDSFMPQMGNIWNSIILIILILLSFVQVRKTLKSVLFSRLRKMIGKERLEFLLRYINIVRFSGKAFQANIFNDLEQQYPDNSKFVVLPMDMEHMDGGAVKESYDIQMEKLLKLKINNPENCIPFIFIDPRRIKQQDPEAPFLKFDISNPEALVLENCLVKDYLDGGFAGIKIYPALGYYPFDKSLLTLWLYCVQNEIPITTHCSIGPIYYRGKLKDLGENYDLHPIFKEVYQKDDDDKPIVKPLRLLQLKNKDFQKNFTHPLNYLCLIHKPLLIKVIEHFDKDGDLKSLFGYRDGDIERDLHTLKVNLAHYGSAEQWEQFLKKDRYQEANAIINSSNGLDLKNRMENLSNFFSFWHYVDWFSIISSMIKEYENVYADISYTAHDTHYLNLLSEIMNDTKIRQRILFGTDFYVVSNHKTEKEFWIDMKHHLNAGKWYDLSYENPNRFLKNLITR